VRKGLRPRPARRRVQLRVKPRRRRPRPQARVAQTGAFTDATKGWRFGGTVGALNGHLAVFLSPDDKPVFARVGGKLADGITVKRLDSGWAQLSVEGAGRN